jgi:hypothetical protein
MGMDINQLRKKAGALGFSFERGARRGAGYVLIDANGDQPLGSDYTASLAEVEKYINNVADDLGVEVEIRDDKESVPPPTRVEIQKSLRGHANAEQIKTVIGPTPPSTRQEQRTRIALDGLLSVGINARSAMAFDQLSEAEKECHHANLRAALATDDKRKAADLPKPSLPLRETGLNPDHPLAQERARQGRVFHKANELLKTNLASLRDYDSGYYRAIAFENGLMMPGDVREFHREQIEEFQPPEIGAYDPAPKATTKVTVASVRRCSKADRLVRQRLWKLRNDIGGAIARDDRAGAGAVLKLVKDSILDHGQFGEWVTREIEISTRSAQRYMEATSGKKL